MTTLPAVPPVSRKLTKTVAEYRTHSLVGDLYYQLVSDLNEANPYFKVTGSQVENSFSTLKCPDFDLCFTLDCADIAEAIRVEKSETQSDFYKIKVVDKKAVNVFKVNSDLRAKQFKTFFLVQTRTLDKFAKLFNIETMDILRKDDDFVFASSIRKIAEGLCKFLGFTPVSGVNCAAATIHVLRNSEVLPKALEKLEEMKLFSEQKLVFGRLRKYVLPFWGKFGIDLEVDIVPQFILPYKVMPPEATKWERRSRLGCCHVAPNPDGQQHHVAERQSGRPRPSSRCSRRRASSPWPRPIPRATWARIFGCHYRWRCWWLRSRTPRKF
jgi:hypothetical protein